MYLCKQIGLSVLVNTQERFHVLCDEDVSCICFLPCMLTHPLVVGLWAIQQPDCTLDGVTKALSQYFV